MARTRIAFGVVAVLLAMGSIAIAQSKDPLVGTWVLNTAKSKYTPGPGPKSASTTIEAAGKGYKFTVHQVPATGADQNWSVTTNLDGKSSPVTGTNPNADAVTYTRVNATTYDSIQMLKGKEMQRQHIVVSADGKTRTVTSTGTNATGKFNNVAVYDKK